MTDSNNSTVSIVAIIAILILVAGGLYFVWSQRSGDTNPTIEIEIDEVLLIDESGASPLSARITLPVRWA
jgi:hypothetical protein